MFYFSYIFISFVCFVCVLTSELLNSTSDGIEVSYNAAGVLSHLACDGAEAWIIDNPRRTDVLKTMVGVIESWDISAKRNINYR